MALENQSQKDFVDALVSRENELGVEVVDQQAVDDLLSTVVERIESLAPSRQDVVLDGFNDLLGQYQVELAYINIGSKEPLETFARDLESKTVNIIGLRDPEFVRLFADVSVLEGQVASAKFDLDSKQENFDTLIKDLDSKTQQREVLIHEFHKIIGDRSLLGDLDSYLHASSYLLFGVGFFIKRFNLHDTEHEEIARDLFAKLQNLDKEIREFSPQLQVSSRELQSAQLKYYESSYRLQNLVGLDASEIAMDAYLALGSATPKYMQADGQVRVKEFEQFHIDQINGAIHLPLAYLNWLKKEVSKDSGTPLDSVELSTFRAAFDTPGSIIRKILEHNPSPGNNGEGFDPHIFMSKEDRRTIPADKHYRVKHCGEARKLIAAGFTGLAHSSEEFLAPGLSRRQERRNMIFYKKVGGNILVQQMVEKRFLKDGTYGYADSYYALEAALPVKVYRETEIHELLDFDKQYAAYNKSEFMSKPEVSVAGSFASKIAPGLQSMQKAIGNRGAKTEEYVKYFKGEAQSLLEKIRGGKDEFLAQKPMLNAYRLQLEQTHALAMSHDVREQVLKTVNSTLKLMKMIEDGSLEKTLNRVVSPNFHADNFDSWFMEEGIVFVAAVTVAVAITYATVGLGSGASGLLLTSAVSSAGGVLGTEIGLGISHVAGQYYFGEGYENLPLALQGKSLGELVESYGKQFMTGFVMSVAAIGCGRLAADKLSKFLVKNSADQTLKGSIARFVSRFPGMRMKVDMADHMAGSARMKFGAELLEELSQETLESVAEKFDSRLGFVMAVLFCSRPSLTSMYFDGAAVGIVSNLEVGDTQLIEMQVDRDFGEEYLKQKFPDSTVEVSEAGGFVVTHEFNGRKQVVTISRGQSSLDVFSRLPVQAQELYGLKVESDGSLTFGSLDAGAGKVSLPGYLKSMGYKVQVDEVDGVKVLKVQGKNGSEFEISESENAQMIRVVESNLGVSFADIAKAMPGFDLNKLVKLTNHIDLMDFSEMTPQEIGDCFAVVISFRGQTLRTEHFHQYIKGAWDYVRNLEPSIEVAPYFLYIRSFYGDTGKVSEYEKWQTWFTENVSESALADIFKTLGVKQFAAANLDGMFNNSRSVSDRVGQPNDVAAHFFTEAKYAVDFIIQSGETVNSPVSGKVVRVHRFEYDLNFDIMGYFDACKAGTAELTLEGVRERMLISNDGVARKTLELGRKFLGSQEAGSNFMNGIGALIDLKTSSKADGVEIEDEAGNRHLILHAKALVSEGEMVKVGQPIVRLDYNSGMSSDPHVHYEVNNSDGKPTPMVDTSQSSSDLYQGNLPGLDRYLRSQTRSVDSVQGVESQQLGDFASVDLSQDVSEFEGYKVTITKADNGQSKARFESLTDVSLNGAELDFTVDGEVATIHWMAAGTSGAGQGKMLFDFLLSRYPVVSTGVEGENISYPAVRRLYTMQQSGDYVVKPNGVKTSPGSASNEHKNRGRRKGRRTLKPNQHYYVAKTENESKIPKLVDTGTPWLAGLVQAQISAPKARSVKVSSENQGD